MGRVKTNPFVREVVAWQRHLCVVERGMSDSQTRAPESLWCTSSATGPGGTRRRQRCSSWKAIARPRQRTQSRARARALTRTRTHTHPNAEPFLTTSRGQKKLRTHWSSSERRQSRWHPEAHREPITGPEKLPWRYAQYRILQRRMYQRLTSTNCSIINVFWFLVYYRLPNGWIEQGIAKEPQSIRSNTIRLTFISTRIRSKIKGLSQDFTPDCDYQLVQPQEGALIPVILIRFAVGTRFDETGKWSRAMANFRRLFRNTIWTQLNLWNKKDPKSWEENAFKNRSSDIYLTASF